MLTIFQVKNNFTQDKQSGITLLLSVLLLSAITTIAFSLAAVGFAEIATSNDLSRTEPILYYSLGLAEEAAYGVKRDVEDIKMLLGAECANTFSQFVLDSNNVTNTKTKICNFNPKKNVEVIVPANTYNSSVRLYIYDPSNSGTGKSGYSKVTFTKTSNNSGSVRIYMCPLSLECTDPNINGNGWVNPAGILLNYDNPEPVTLADGSYEVVFINAGSGSTALEYVQVSTEPKGLPYLNKEGIEIQSSFGRLIRRLRVLVPTQ